TELTRVVAEGEKLREGGQEGPRYSAFATTLSIYPPQPVVPGGQVTLEIDWSFDIPRRGAGGRMGWRDDESFFLAYWYPQMAVYNDVVGWQADWFLGLAEFYAGFASYDLTVEVPEGFVVMATGTLENPDEVLAPAVAERFLQAATSDAVVHVVTAEDRGTCTRSGEDGYLRWHFVSDRVRDVTFAASSAQLWDAARTPVGDRDGDGTTDYTRVDALYSEGAPRWARMVGYEQHAITFHSDYTGIPYPWPHMTAVESGGGGGGMEYPMMTLIGDYTQSNDTAFYHVTAHELAHMWQPMIVNSDERRHAWIDEGAATFLESQAARQIFPGRDNEALDREVYLRMARLGFAGEMMRWSELLGLQAYSVTSYQKSATVLAVLRELLGEETFLRAYRTFLGEWAFKHPYPWDLFATFERVSGRELDWFWRSWYYETWTLDQAVVSVEETGDGTRIVIMDKGWIPMPVRLIITRADGQLLNREIPVEAWLAGATTAAITVPPGAPVSRVEIDASHAFPDIDRDNNVWVR
ncbi:MAG: M1 family metallopeptidase, partial [Gemmatimonadales bacterium]